MAKPRPAPVVNPLLARLLASERNPVEPLSADQVRAVNVWTLGAANVPTWRGRVVELACGHLVVTRALRESGCPRCGEMIRAGWDYDGFRRLGGPDTFHWPDDPFRVHHEGERGPGEHGGRFDPTDPR